MIRRIRLRHVLAALAILLVSIALAGWLILSPEKVDTLAPGEAATGVLRGETPVPLRRDTMGRTTATRARKASAADALCA